MQRKKQKLKRKSWRELKKNLSTFNLVSCEWKEKWERKKEKRWEINADADLNWRSFFRLFIHTRLYIILFFLFGPWKLRCENKDQSKIPPSFDFNSLLLFKKARILKHLKLFALFLFCNKTRSVRKPKKKPS